VRVFLDTNVLVSAFATRGLCAELFEVVLLEHELVVGRQVLQELAKALRSKLRLSAPRIREIVDFVTDEAERVVDNADAADAGVDPADARVLGEALAAGADLIVTGDAALLRLGAIAGIAIVPPRRFWEILRLGPASGT
jgi:putative PIN family toxin of toxin-antitoxin system